MVITIVVSSYVETTPYGDYNDWETDSAVAEPAWYYDTVAADTTAAYPDYDYATDSLVGDPYY